MPNSTEVGPSHRQDRRPDQQLPVPQLHAMNGAHPPPPPQQQQQPPPQQQQLQQAQIPVMVAHYPGASGIHQQMPYQQAMYYPQQPQTPQQPQPEQPPPPPQQQQAPTSGQQGSHPHTMHIPHTNHQMQMGPGAPPPLQHLMGSPHPFHPQSRHGMDAPAIPGSTPNIQGAKHAPPTGTQEPQRKRYRRPDHAFPGEDGDLELRNMAMKILDVPLEEFAAKVRAIESSVSSPPAISAPTNGRQLVVRNDASKERQRQVFGMSWLMRACQASPASVVPRNRIYARYVGICAEYGLKPLSPASFGKLVRLVFPNLTTRRLGIRGQSKYHYCGLKLIVDDGGASSIGSSSNTPLHNQTFDSSFMPGTPYGSHSPASFHSQVSTPLLSNPTSSSTNVTSITSFLNGQVTQELKFVPDLSTLINDKGSSTEQQIELPDIKPYLPETTDKDAADTLMGLYKSHCTSVFESVRYIQLQRLFGLISSFHGSLTTPVLRLYSSPDVLPWVVACDAAMFKALIKMLAKLALQEIPDIVLEQLKNLVAKFTDKLSESLGSLPIKLAYAKIKLAKKFTQLVSRFVRVVETAQSANKILAHHMDRNVMYNDWTKHVNIEQLAARELPCDGENYKSAIDILQNKIPELLKKETSVYDSFIVEWGTYIASLPELFSNVPPRLFLLCTSALLTSALREISLAGGGGFGAWWVVRCWVDEWIGWCAELGGFISCTFEDSDLLQGPADANNRTFVKPDSDNDKESQSSAKVTDDLGADTIDLLDGQFGGILSAENDVSQSKK